MNGGKRQDVHRVTVMTTVALLKGRTRGKARFLSLDKATSTTSQSAYTARSVRTDVWTKNGRGFSLIPYNIERREIAKWTW
jgi:hypothetical protein